MAKGALPFITQCLNCSWLKLNHVWRILYTIIAPFKTSIHSDYDSMNRPRLQNQFELKTIWAEKSEISTYASFKSSVYEQSNTSVNLLADCNSFFSNSKQLKWQHISYINDNHSKRFTSQLKLSVFGHNVLQRWNISFIILGLPVLSGFWMGFIYVTSWKETDFWRYF